MEDLAHRTALAVDNARLYASVQGIAERLQRSLLPELPHVDHLQPAARYTPARSTAEVGGDRYDSFVLPDGTTSMIIGDVAGHDLPTAVAMAQLRNMLRALACDRREPPGEILARLDAINDSLYGGRTATCVFARIEGPEGGPWRLNHSNAGHPPPLLVTHDGDTRYLQEGHGMLLGVEPGTARPSATTPMPERPTLLLYTDGLVERPGESLDHSLARLRQHAAALAREPLDVFCDELLKGLYEAAVDDVALPALRLPPTGAGAGRGGRAGAEPGASPLSPECTSRKSFLGWFSGHGAPGWGHSLPEGALSMIVKKLHDKGVTSEHAYMAAFASIGLSILSWAGSLKAEPAGLDRADRWGIFVGEWAPTFFGLGIALAQYEQKEAPFGTTP